MGSPERRLTNENQDEGPSGGIDLYNVDYPEDENFD